MSKECGRISACGFLKKYYTSHCPDQCSYVASMGFIHEYCHGPKMDECARKIYFDKHGKAPSEDMMPNGEMVKKKHPAGLSG